MKRLILIILVFGLLLNLVSCVKKPKLYLFSWTDYIAPELIRKFERDNDCKVVLDTYNSNETMHAKLLTSKSAYDIIIPSGDYISILIDDGLLEKINLSSLSNYSNLDPVILNKVEEYEFDLGYTVPYFWGTSGVIYNKKLVSEEDMTDISWDVFQNQKYANKITMLDDIREVIGVALIHNGFNPNDTSETALAIARESLLLWDLNVVQYDSDSFKNEVQDGTIWLGQAYNGDALQVMEENGDIAFVLPKEGSTLWIDFFAIPKNSENKELAHKYIDFLLDEKNALTNAEYVLYATPNVAAYKLLNKSMQENKNIYPVQEYLDKCFLIKNIRNEVLKLDVIWQEIRNN